MTPEASASTGNENRPKTRLCVRTVVLRLDVPHDVWKNGAMWSVTWAVNSAPIDHSTGEQLASSMAAVAQSALRGLLSPSPNETSRRDVSFLRYGRRGERC